VADRLKVADYFVLITGQNRTHVRALTNELHVRLKALGERHQPLEGAELGWWVVLDYGDVVVHVLQPEAREYYDIEHLYQDSPRVDWRSVSPPMGRAAEV
jgi:ribosome-associated protein